MTLGSCGFKSHPRHHWKSKMNSSTSKLRTLLFLAFFLTSHHLWSDSFEDHLVYIKGSSLRARDVLDQVEDQVDVRLILRAKDRLAYRKNYDDLVTVAQVIDALKLYYRDHMGVELDMRSFGRHRYVIFTKNVIASDMAVSDDSDSDVAVLDSPMMVISDLEWGEEADLSSTSDLLAKTLPESAAVDEAQASEWEPVDMVPPKPKSNFLNVEVMGRPAVAPLEQQASVAKSSSVGHSPKVFELDDLVVAGDKFVGKEGYLSWSERLAQLFGPDSLGSSDDGLIRSPVMVGMMRYQNIFSPVKAGVSFGFSTSTLSSGSDLDATITEGVVAFQHKTKDDFDLRLNLASAYEKSDVKMGATQYRSRVYGLSALDFSMAKEVYSSSDFTGRMALKFKVPLMTESKGLMGGSGLDLGLSTGLGYDALDAFWSVQLDLSHYSDHDRLGATQSLVPSLSLSCEGELSEWFSGSFGAIWGESPFRSSSHAWLSDDQLMFVFGMRSFSRQLPLAAHLYVGASESSPDVGLTITWFPNIKMSL